MRWASSFDQPLRRPFLLSSGRHRHLNSSFRVQSDTRWTNPGSSTRSRPPLPTGFLDPCLPTGPARSDSRDCSEAAKLDRFWLEFSVVIPRLGGAESDEGLEFFGRPEGVHSQARWHTCGGYLPQGWHQPGDLFQLEEEVWKKKYGRRSMMVCCRRRCAASSSSRMRMASCGTQLRQRDAAIHGAPWNLLSAFSLNTVHRYGGGIDGGSHERSNLSRGLNSRDYVHSFISCASLRDAEPP